VVEGGGCVSGIHVLVYTITICELVLVCLMQCCKQLMVSAGPQCVKFKLVCFILPYLFSMVSYVSVK
jgi:hypothetical protein